MDLPITGGCACKRIRYECAVAPIGMGHCHCRDCQYSSGTGYTSVIAVPSSAVKVTGEPKKYESKAESGSTVWRSFCPECGTPLFAGSYGSKDHMGIKVATLDDPSWFSPKVDLWVSSAQPWDMLSPETQKFEQNLEV